MEPSKQFQLFHGSTADLKPGDIVEPTLQAWPSQAHPIIDRSAHATGDPVIARSYALPAHKEQQPALFYPVYSVEPLDESEMHHTTSSIPDEYRVDPTHMISTRGFRVKGVAEWMTNTKDEREEHIKHLMSKLGGTWRK